jgi:hypothetical protein
VGLSTAALLLRTGGGRSKGREHDDDAGPVRDARFCEGQGLVLECFEELPILLRVDSVFDLGDGKTSAKMHEEEGSRWDTLKYDWKRLVDRFTQRGDVDAGADAY